MPTRTSAPNLYQLQKVAIERSVPVISKQNLDDLTQMMKYMPLVDKQFYVAFKKPKQRNKIRNNESKYNIYTDHSHRYQV